MQYVIYQTYRDDSNALNTGDYAYTETLCDAISEMIKASQDQVKSVALVNNVTRELILEHECFERDYLTELTLKFQSLGGMAALFAHDCEGLPVEKAFNELVNAIDSSWYYDQALGLVTAIEPNFNY